MMNKMHNKKGWLMKESATNEDESVEVTKRQVLQSRAVQARIDIDMLNLYYGNVFFDELEAGKYD